MSEQHEIEVTVELLKKQVANKEALYRLLQNDDFKSLLLEGYIKDEAVRGTKLLGDPAMRANQRAFDSTVDELKAIGLFDNHLRTIEQLGQHAED
jgi:hypothetical protein